MKVRLNEKELALLEAWELQGTASYRELGDQTGVASHVVQYFLGDLKEKELIKQEVVFNYSLISCLHLSLFLSIDPSRLGENHPAQLRETCRRIKALALYEASGPFQYVLKLSAWDFHSAATRIATVCESLGPSLTNHLILIEKDKNIFGHQLTAKGPQGVRSIQVMSASGTFETDDRDKEIIYHFEKDGIRTARDIAAAIGTPERTVLFKIKRLLNSRVIAGYVCSPVPSLLNMSTFSLLVRTQSVSYSISSELLELGNSHPLIIRMIKHIGEYGLEILIDAPGIESAYAVSQEVSRLVPGLISSHIIQVGRNLLIGDESHHTGGENYAVKS